MWNEARIVKRRHHSRMRNEAALMHATIVQAIAGGEHLKTLLERLDDE
jgi:hypothetical protein